MRRAVVISIFILAVMLCAVGAYANQIIQTSGTYSLEGDEQYWNVNPFDPSLGQLTSVTIDLSSGVGGTWSITNAGSKSVHTSGTIYGFNDVGYDLSAAFNGDAFASDTYSWSTTLPSKGSSIGSTLSGADSETFSYSNSSNNLSAFTSPWQVSFNNYSAFESLNIPATANLTNFITGTGNATVIYNYKPVPEPSSLLVLIAGGAGLLGFMKRRTT